MTKRKSLLENIIIFGCVVFTVAAIVVALILFLIQPQELCDLFTSSHTIGLFCFATGAVISCIVTAYVLCLHFSKKIERKNKCIKKLVEDRKQLSKQIYNMSQSAEKVNLVENPPSKPKDILGEIEDLSDIVEDDEPKEEANTQEETSADES